MVAQRKLHESLSEENSTKLGINKSRSSAGSPSVPLESSEPDARSLGSDRLKSTLQQRFSCS